ncbi:hypothetical protein PFISCL1PPCAC_21657, partial [Pristionchus fissidentatus]
DCIVAELKSEVKKMRDTHSAQIHTIYIGRNTDEKEVEKMRAITSEDEELTVNDFDDLKETVLDRLQMKIC